MEQATEANGQSIATDEKVLAAPEDAEARFLKLEEEKENYRKAYLKESEKNKGHVEYPEYEEKMVEVARKVLTESRLAEIAREQDAIIQKALKENKELKLAQLNKTTATPVAAVGTHSESTPVRDTLITPEQLAAFKAKGWSDQDIERYKKNLARNTR
jgi:hypothetical protein